MKKKLPKIILPILILLWIPLVCLGFTWVYTTTQLAIAKSQGVYESPQVGMLTRLEKSYSGIQKIVIEHAGPNFPNGKLPHVWFVVARVYADKRADGNSVGNGRTDYDFPGSYYLKTRDGWVYMPEGAFPEFVGRMMVFFDMENQGVR